jgi:hypothetical protein
MLFRSCQVHLAAFFLHFLLAVRIYILILSKLNLKTKNEKKRHHYHIYYSINL